MVKERSGSAAIVGQQPLLPDPAPQLVDLDPATGGGKLARGRPISGRSAGGGLTGGGVTDGGVTGDRVAGGRLVTPGQACRATRVSGGRR